MSAAVSRGRAREMSGKSAIEMNSKWLLAGALAASLSAADVKAPPWETSRFVIGRDLFRGNCAVCHDIDKDKCIRASWGRA